MNSLINRVAFRSLKSSKSDIIKLINSAMHDTMESQSYAHRSLDKLILSNDDVRNLTFDEKSEIMSIKNKIKSSYKCMADVTESLDDLIYSIMSHK